MLNKVLILPLPLRIKTFCRLKTQIPICGYFSWKFLSCFDFLTEYLFSTERLISYCYWLLIFISVLMPCIMQVNPQIFCVDYQWGDSLWGSVQEGIIKQFSANHVFISITGYHVGPLLSPAKELVDRKTPRYLARMTWWVGGDHWL